MPPIVFDLLILALLAFFAWRGAKKGLVLSLCSLAGIFLAFFGARFVSGEFCLPVSDIIEPGIYQTVLGAEPETAADPEASSPPNAGSHGSQQPVQPAYTLDELLESVREEGLFSGLAQFVDRAVEEDQIQATSQRTAAQALADYLSKLIAKAGLFAVTFLVILLVWFLVGQLLNLAFQLPILAAVNLAGGLALGLVKAALIAVVLVWLGQLFGLVPLEPDTPVLSLFTPRALGELLNRVLV